MFRYIRWSLLAAYLLIVGLWPAAAAPVTVACAGLAVIVAAVSGKVLLLAAGAVWLRNRPAVKAAV